MISKFATKHEKKIYRSLEITTGVLTWSLFLSPVWLGILAPRILIFYISFLTIYWTYLALKHSAGIYFGYKFYKQELEVDWLAEYNKLDISQLPDKATLPNTLQDLKFFLLIPVYNEPYELLKDSFESLVNQTFPLKQVTLVYAVEEKHSERVIADIKNIYNQQLSHFDEILFFVHPAGIEGEAIGVAGANRAWGAKRTVEHLQQSGKNIRDFIFMTMDSDHVLNPQFLARVAHLYLSTDRRDNHFYSTAVHLFDNNLWEVPILSRIEANSVTLGSLSDWVVSSPDLKETFSNYASSLQTLIDADYWDVERGIDDTLFYWRAFFARNGDFQGVKHFIPYSADAVQSSNTVKTYKSMYMQLRRWGWGAISVPLSITGFLKTKSIPFSKKLLWVYTHFKLKVVMLSVVFLMTFGLSIVTLVNQDARQISLIYSLPKVMSYILTVTLVFLIPITVYRAKITRQPPKNWPIYKKAMILLEGPLIIFNLLTFSLMPFVDAQTRMLFGKRMKDLYVTPKIR